MDHATRSEHIQRIARMETAFDETTETLARAESALDELEAAEDNLFAFSDYYGSEQWFEDVDAHAQGELPDGLKCGVLGEDLPYDALVGYRDLCIRMLEVATHILKRI